MQKEKVILGNIVNPKSDKLCDFYPQGAMILRMTGKSQWKVKELLTKNQWKEKKSGYARSQIKNYEDSIIIPSFFDMHFHWVQDDVRLMPKDSLLEWLEKYTFPAEMKFAKKNLSKSTAKSFFKKLSKQGTLGGACYSSVHGHALEDAQKAALGEFVIGNVLMTMNSPHELLQNPVDAQKLAERMGRKYREKYAVTPRFAPTTDPETMKFGVQVAQKHNCFIQSHLSETKAEIDYVLSIYRKFEEFSKVKNYTEIYQKVEMLGPKTFFGHGIHLSDSELKLLGKTKTAIIHCPTSNAPIKEMGLGSGLFDYEKTNRFKVPWALGSDIGGGPFVCMLDVMNSFVKQHVRKGKKSASYVMALYRSTLAGAKLLQIEKEFGNFEAGKWANIVVLRPSKKRTNSAELSLKQLLLPLWKNREKTHQLVKDVFYKGERLSYK